GNVGAAGGVSFNGTIFNVSGAGSEIDSGATDAFHFVYQPLNGDGSIVARVTNLASNRRAGVMIRETLDAASANVFMNLYGGAGPGFSYRASTGAGAGGVGGPTVTLPYWVKLTRLGSTFTGSISSDGVSWTQVGSVTIPMAMSVYMGLAVTARDTSAAITATFDNLSTINGQDFLLTVAAAAVITGSSIQYTVNVSALGGFTGPVSLSVSGLPSGATSSFSPSSLSSGNSVLTVTAAVNTPANSYPLVITGAS